MRIADNMSYDQVTQNLAKNRSEISDLQNKAATQKRVTKPSDDPIAAARVLASRIELSGNKQYLKNLDYVRSHLEFTDQSLGELTEHLVRLKEITLSQASDASANPQSRRVVATEVGQLYDQIVQIGNRKLGDRYIFGGYKTDTPPFNYQGKYQGDAGEILIQVDKGSNLAMNIPGSKIFSGIGLSRDKVSHVTSVQPESVEELLEQRQKEKEVLEQQNANTQVRGPASVGALPARSEANGGLNLFNVVSKLKVALSTNDKVGVQESLDKIDGAIEQVVLARSQVGSRVMVLNSAMETLQKQGVDSKILISQLEDADAFEVISDMNKSEGTLKATLETSGKLIQRSLMDFLR